MEEKQKGRTICFHCGAVNRVPPEAFQPGKKVLCGRCHNALPEPGVVLDLSPERVYVLIKNGSLPLLFEFYSTQCPHCWRMHPIIERLARRRAGEMMVGRINTDHYPELASGFGVKAVPTFIIVCPSRNRGWAHFRGDGRNGIFALGG